MARLSRRELLKGCMAAALPLAGCRTSDPTPNDASLQDGETGVDTPTPMDRVEPLDNSPVLDAGTDAQDTVNPDSGCRSGSSFCRPGTVVQVVHDRVIQSAVIQAVLVREMMTRGMCELTGRATETEAWQTFFSPADIVGIKVSPVGAPDVVSHVETVLEIVRGLQLAGVASTNIIVFDRYRNELAALGLDTALPAGVRLAGVVEMYTDDQTGLTGYDPNEYVDFPRVFPGDDATNPQKRRSYLCDIVSRQVTKVVNVPALKDHGSAGITMALKNMTYGMVNNVSRTHVAPDNWTKDFLPGIAAMPKIREKVVLHIGDGLLGCYDGGPAANLYFRTFPCHSLFFATDPVSMDRVGWKLIDEQRLNAGLPLLADCGLMRTNSGHESFDERQPQHVLEAARAGLGIADLGQIQHRIITLA